MDEEGSIVSSQNTPYRRNVADRSALVVSSVQKVGKLVRETCAVYAILILRITPCDKKAILKPKRYMVDLLYLG